MKMMMMMIGGRGGAYASLMLRYVCFFHLYKPLEPFACN